jgi:hypothetical protein
MHTRLIEADTAREPRTEVDTTVAEQLLGALKHQPGYAGAFTVPDQARGDELTIVLWQTEAQARRALAEYGATARRRLVAASVRQRD